MTDGTKKYPVAICDFNIDSSAGQNGYLLKGIQGIDPPKINAVVEGFDSSGYPIMGPVSEKRVLSCRVALKPGLGQTYSSLREELYGFMGRSLRVDLMQGPRTIAIATGYIPNVEAVHFSERPDLQVNINCDLGELVAPESVPIPLELLNVAQPIISYPDGSAPTGLNLQFTVTANHSAGFDIYNHAQLWYSGNGSVDNHFTVAYPLLTGDVVTLDTNNNSKRVSLVRSSVTHDLAGYLNRGAVWPKLHKGVNVWNWTLDASWMTLNSASYTPRFWGV